MNTRRDARDLVGKTIDAHAHVGVSMKAYAAGEYPYAQSLEGLYYRQLAAGVDGNVVFPYSADLAYDLSGLLDGELKSNGGEFSEAPYAAENRLLLREVYDYCPELSERFLPFVCVDPGRVVDVQLRVLERLYESYPIYGIKIVPVSVQTCILELLTRGQAFLSFAEERDLPFLIHTTGDPSETYSQPADVLAVAEARPGLRFCLAHCSVFSQSSLERIGSMENTWFDTSALKIQVQMVHEESPLVPPPAERFDTDYSDYVGVMRDLAAAYPESIIWGTDSPAYSYICRRKQGAGSFAEFRLKGTYLEEKAALDSLPQELRARAGGANALEWLGMG